MPTLHHTTPHHTHPLSTFWSARNPPGMSKRVAPSPCQRLSKRSTYTALGCQRRSAAQLSDLTGSAITTLGCDYDDHERNRDNDGISSTKSLTAGWLALTPCYVTDMTLVFPTTCLTLDRMCRWSLDTQQICFTVYFCSSVYVLVIGPGLGRPEKARRVKSTHRESERGKKGRGKKIGFMILAGACGDIR